MDSVADAVVGSWLVEEVGDVHGMWAWRVDGCQTCRAGSTSSDVCSLCRRPKTQRSAT